MTEAARESSAIGNVPTEQLGDLLILGYAQFLRNYQGANQTTETLRNVADGLYRTAIEQLSNQRQLLELGRDEYEPHESFLSPATEALALEGLADAIDSRDGNRHADYNPVSLVGRLVTVSAIERRPKSIRRFIDDHLWQAESITGTLVGSYLQPRASWLALNVKERFRHRIWDVREIVDMNDFNANVTLLIHD